MIDVTAPCINPLCGFLQLNRALYCLSAFVLLSWQRALTALQAPFWAEARMHLFSEIKLREWRSLCIFTPMIATFSSYFRVKRIKDVTCMLCFRNQWILDWRWIRWSPRRQSSVSISMLDSRLTGGPTWIYRWGSGTNMASCCLHCFFIVKKSLLYPEPSSLASVN